jgi:hypothetical protein
MQVEGDETEPPDDGDRLDPTTSNFSLSPRPSSHALARSSRRRCATEETIVPFIGM